MSNESANEAVYRLLRQIEANARQNATFARTVMAQLNELHVDEKPKAKCPVCGIPAQSQRQLEEHVYDIHDGPRPSHFDVLEAKIAPDWTPEETHT